MFFLAMNSDANLAVNLFCAVNFIDMFKLRWTYIAFIFLEIEHAFILIFRVHDNIIIIYFIWLNVKIDFFNCKCSFLE